jgi:hypothetical protein
MSGTGDSIWDDDTWDVDCPPSVPMELWEMVPENYRREFIIEAAFALRRGIHPVDTFEEMLEEKGVIIQRDIKNAIPDFELDEPARPSGRMSFGASKKSADKEITRPVAPVPMKRQEVTADKNSAAAKLWPSKVDNKPALSRPIIPLGINHQSINKNNNSLRPSRIGLSSNLNKQIIVDDIGDTF